MSYGRIVLAGVVGTVVFFISGFLVFGLLIAKYYAPYPGVYRSLAAVQPRVPIGLASCFLAILVLAAIYAKGYEGGAGIVEGARFGLLVGLFVVFAVVGDEYVTLNIGRRLALAMAAGRFVEWILVGMAIGLVYKPAAAPTKQIG
jgi:F0F1-type ATP synthase membrane subunit a